MPVLGQLGTRNLAEKCRQWTTTYGDLFQIQLGQQPVIVVNSASMAKEVFARGAMALNSRPVLWTFHEVLSKFSGATLGTAPNSKTVNKSRKDTPLGKAMVKSYTRHLDVETQEFIQQCRDALCEPIDPLRLLQRMSLSLDLTLCWGRRISLDDQLLDDIVQNEHQIVELRNGLKTYQDGLPFLRHFCTGATRRALALRGARDRYYQSLNQELDLRLTQEPVSCMRASLLRAEVPEEELNMVCMTFISAGMAPTVATLYWSLALLAQRRDLQCKAMSAIAEHRKSHSEADDLEDGPGCAYVVALVKECLRYFTVARLALPRASTKDICISDRVIPAGTTVFLNAWSCNRDSSTFGDADEFDPDRYLSNPTLPLFSYGVGARSCSGTILANKLLYLFFIRLTSAFEMSVLDPVNVDPVTGCVDQASLVSMPRNFKVVFRPRTGVVD